MSALPRTTRWKARFGCDLSRLLAGILFVAFAHLATAADSPTGELQAGASAVDITPLNFPISSNGGMSDRLVTHAADPLHARCLVLDNGHAALAIVVCDSCAIPRDIFDAAKQIAHSATGIPAEHMLMSATHTHSAVTVTGVFQSDPDLAYREFLTVKIAEAVEQAYSRLEPARIGWGVGHDASQVFNRRWHTKPGVVNEDPFGTTRDTVRMNPGFDQVINGHPSGPVDSEVCVLSVQSREGRPLTLLANYSLHYVGGVPGDALSADYFAEFANRIGERLGAADASPPFVGIMSNGTSGNINNINFGGMPVPAEPFERIRAVAASVADAAFQACQSIEYHDAVVLAAAQEEIDLGVRLPTEQDIAAAETLLADAGAGPYTDRKHIYARETLLLQHYPARVKALIQALRIGDAGIVSSPCETFVETGLAVKADSPLQPAFCIELANGYNGYLPTAEHHALGGYETWRARSSYLDEQAETRLRQTQLSLLRQLAP